MNDDIIIPRSELEGRLSARWKDLNRSGERGERLACDIPDGKSFAEWHYERALQSLAAAAEMKRLGF